jgi:hypothetical protein
MLRPVFRRGVPLPLDSMWRQADLVSTGNTAGQSLVRQVFRAPESPVGRVYACEARFEPSVIVKRASANVPARALWYSFFPDCAMDRRADRTAAAAERLWFFRVEGTLLRPIADDARAFIPLVEKLSSGRGSELAEILPRQVILERGGTPEFGSFVHHCGLACAIVGENECRKIVTKLQASASLVVKREMCEVFWISYGYCTALECSRVPGYRLTMDEASIDRMASGRKFDLTKRIADSTIVGVLSNGRAAEMEALRQNILRWACNGDSEIRLRARAVLAKYFPTVAQAPIACPVCQ